MISSRSLVGVVLFVGSVLGSVLACGSDTSTFTSQGVDAGPDGSGPLGFASSDASGPCTGIACQRVACSGGATTTVTGTVFAPNGTLPLYNVIVYVPQAPLSDIPVDLTCDHCGSVSGSPLVSTLSQADGTFRLENVPAGSNVPLVLQVGKWRRQVMLPTLTACQNNALTDANLTRLPRDKSEGSIPKIAVTTGKCDELACLLPKLGLAASEVTPNTGDGRLNVYQGHRYDNGNLDAPAPAGTPSAEDLYSNFSRYDIVVLSCECGTYAEDYTAKKRQKLYDYVSAGGRLFASHLQYGWLYDTPLRDVATWRDPEDLNTSPDGPFLVDQSFDKGKALASWLVTVNATAEADRGTIPLAEPREDVGAITSSAQRWIYAKTTTQGLRPESAKYYSVNAPVGVDTTQQCGKFVFADVHLAHVDETAIEPDNGFPGSCGADLTPEEKALAFLFFDLASCVQDDKQPPAPPVK